MSVALALTPLSLASTQNTPILPPTTDAFLQKGLIVPVVGSEDRSDWMWFRRGKLSWIAYCLHRMKILFMSIYSDAVWKRRAMHGIIRSTIAQQL